MIKRLLFEFELHITSCVSIPVLQILSSGCCDDVCNFTGKAKMRFQRILGL